MENSNIIQERMLGNIDEKFDKTTGSFFYDALKPVAIELEEVNREMKVVESKLDAENLSGEELDLFVNQRTGITRKLATKATTVITIVGQEGAKINKGDLVGADTVNFIVKEKKTVDSTGKMSVLAECEEYGIIGNVPTGAIKYFPISISGLVTVANLATVTNGYDAESDESLLERYYERIRTPATSGNKYHYLNWAKEVTGVGDARVVPLWNGDNTVKVILIDSNKQPASEDLIDRVQNHIDPNIAGLGEGQAPIGAFSTVVGAIGRVIDIRFTVSRSEDYSIEQIKLDVENNILEYLKSIAFKENMVSHAKIGAIILSSGGVLDYTDLTVSDGTTNILVADEQVAILGTVVIDE